VLHLSGVIAHQSGKSDIAIGLISRAIQINPEQASFYSNLGNALMEEGRLDEAVECYQKALEIKSDYIDAHDNLGKTFRDLGMLDQATSLGKYLRVVTLPDGATLHNAFPGILSCFEPNTGPRPHSVPKGLLCNEMKELDTSNDYDAKHQMIRNPGEKKSYSILIKSTGRTTFPHRVKQNRKG